MGRYIKHSPRSPATVSGTVRDAEHDHYLDCPDVEPPLRASAFLIDVFFFFLLGSGLHNFIHILIGAMSFLIAQQSWPKFWVEVLLFRLALATLTYFYFAWTTTSLGGSPGKLLLGLRVVDSSSGRWLVSSRAIMREFLLKPATVVSIVGLLMPVFREDKKMFHDIVLGSSVKRLLPYPDRSTTSSSDHEAL